MSCTSQTPCLQKHRDDEEVTQAMPAPTAGSQVEMPEPKSIFYLILIFFFLSASPVQEKEGKTSEEALV